VIQRKYERFQCEQCPCFRLDSNISGYEAYCTGRSDHGRILNWQYGLDMQWCKAKLMNWFMNHMSPWWCPRSHGALKAEYGQSADRNPLYESHGNSAGQRKSDRQQIENDKEKETHD